MPARILLEDEPKMANPSSRPIRVLDTPSVSFRNTGSVLSTISEPMLQRNPSSATPPRRPRAAPAPALPLDLHLLHVLAELDHQRPRPVHNPQRQLPDLRGGPLAF